MFSDQIVVACHMRNVNAFLPYVMIISNEENFNCWSHSVTVAMAAH